MLAKKLATPEGMALIKAKIAEIEGAPADPALGTRAPSCSGVPPAKS